MDFEIPKDIAEFLAELDAFIEREIKPLEAADDNVRFFDHRRENERTVWDRDGRPSAAWTALILQAQRLADRAVAVDAHQERVPEVARLFEVGHMPNVQQVKTTVGHHQGLAPGAHLRTPGGERFPRKHFLAKVHAGSLGKAWTRWQGLSGPHHQAAFISDQPD